MSLIERQHIVDDGRVLFQNPTVQRLDLIDPMKTDSNLIALLQHIVDGGFYVELTAVRSDHHDDGRTEHAGGLAFDGWPTNTTLEGDWMDQGSQRFREYLAHVAAFPGIRNIGLAGSAYTDLNIKATGLELTNAPEMAETSCVFEDSGADHIHHDVHPA